MLVQIIIVVVLTVTVGPVLFWLAERRWFRDGIGGKAQAMTCERCGADTMTGQYLDEQIVYICDDCYGAIGPRDDFDLDDNAAELDRDRAADEVERHGTT